MEPESSLRHSQVPATSIYSIPPYPTFLILSSHSRLGLPSCLFPSGFPHQKMYNIIFPHTRYMPRPSNSTRFYYPNSIGSLGSPFFSFFHSPVTSSLLGPNILLRTLFLNTLSLRSSLNVSDQVSHPYKTTGKIIVLYILMFIFLDSKLEDKITSSCWTSSTSKIMLHPIRTVGKKKLKTKDSAPNDSNYSLTSICTLNFFLNRILIC